MADAEYISPSAVRELSAREGYYAITRWNWGDIMQVATRRGFAITEEQALEWLKSHQEQISDRLVELGWDVISDLMDDEDFESEDDEDDAADEDGVGDTDRSGEEEDDYYDEPEGMEW